MTLPTSLPPSIYEWPAGDVGAMWGQVLRQIANTLRTRSDHAKDLPVTCWTTQSISAEEYNMWRHDGDQQRKASRPDPPENLSGPESAPPAPTPSILQQRSISQQRSRDMRATHYQMRIGLVVVMLSGWESLIYKHQAGIHMALDVIDNVRVKITSLDRVAQINDSSTVPILVPDAAVSPDRRQAIVDIAAQLGHADMGDALRIAGNFLLSWQYCRDHDIDPRSADGAAILAQRTPSALILCGGENISLAEEVKTLYHERLREAMSRQESYKKRGLAPPSSHRYA